MDKQEIFDTVVLALKKQGKPSVDSGACVYRATDGSKCAAGHLLPDEYYDSDMEAKDWVDVVNKFGNDLPKFLVEEKYIISSLQKAHDTWAKDLSYEDKVPFPRQRFENVAKAYGLQMPEGV